jgi:hypothetical protein
MQSVFLNGGMIGTTLDFGSADQYILSTSQQRVRPTFVGNQFFGRSGSTSSTTVGFALSAGTGETVPQAGDLVLLTIAHGAAETTLMIGPTDYTQLARISVSDTNDTVLYVGYKIMGPTPDTTFPVVSSLSTSNAQTAIVFVFRGVDPTNPIDVTTTTATGANSRLANPPAITPITQNATVVAIGAGGHTASSVNYTTTDLTNFKTLFSTDTYDIVHGAGYFEWTSGAADPAAFGTTNDSTSDSWCSATVALRPALVDVPVYGNFKKSGIWLLQAAYENSVANLSPVGQTLYTAPGTYSWTAPAGVTSVSVVAVGGGGASGDSGNSWAGAGGGGGGLGWKNAISVVPGQSYTVVVGAGGTNPSGNGGVSYFINTSTVAGNGGIGGTSTDSQLDGGFGGTFVGDGGGNGGRGGRTGDNAGGGAGGGAGGYTGNGGNGGAGNNDGLPGTAGAGGGGGGGEGSSGGTRGGGGVGLNGEGTSGAYGSADNGGSGGAGGVIAASSGQLTGGAYGGGGGAEEDDTIITGTLGAGGAVRIIWGSNRAFPSTNTGDL